MTKTEKEQIETALRCVPDYDPWREKGDAYLDHEAAAKAINFFAERLKHVEGSARGNPFILRKWQAAIVGNLFGWKRKDESGRIVRRYRKSLIFVPRGNGKTPLAAGIVLYAFFEDHEPGAQCYLAAGQREQAGILFRNARGMVEQDADLKSAVTIYGGDQHRSIVLKDDPLSFCKVIPADAAGQHGGIPHVTVVDELHVQENRDLLDVFETAMSKKVRAQPMLVMITTSDFDRESICNETYDYACKVRDSVIDDPQFLPVIYEAGTESDWTEEATWQKANPNLGVSVSLESMRSTCKKAQELATFENTFKRLHLNIRTQNDVRWIRLEDWDRCANLPEAVSPQGWRERIREKLAGRRCHAALDLSSKIDITASLLLFPPTEDDPLWYVVPRFWVPRANAHRKEQQDRVPYETWSRQGFVELTEGNVVDYDFIKAGIFEDARDFDIADIAYDPWNATQIALQLAGEGLEVVEFSQGFKSMSEPAKELEKLVIAGKIAHGANPVLRWMANNTAAENDAAGNIKPSKKKSTGRIDGIVTLVMALGRALVSPIDAEGPSVTVI